MLMLAARLLVTALPFHLWRNWLGGKANAPNRADVPAARRLAAQIERAASLLPFTIKCLPQAMALSWLLQQASLGHSIVFAGRPAGHRAGRDDLHAWVEVGTDVLLGDLPGPWLLMFKQGR